MKESAHQILLIEDNAGDTRLIREYLRQAGFQFVLHHVGCLADGLRYLDSHRVDVVLLDLSLPDSRGWETFSRAYHHAPAVPVVILTGLQDEDLALKAVGSGAQDYLVKGEFSSSFLARTVSYAIERQQLLKNQQKLNRALTVLSDVNQAVVRAQEEQALLDEVCAILTESGGYRLAWVGFAEQDDEKRVRPVARAGAGADYLQLVDIVWADTELGRGPTGRAIRAGRPFIMRNMQNDPAFAPWREAAGQYGFQASIALPLSANGHTFGALNIYTTETAAFDEEEVELLIELAGDLAYGIDTLRNNIALHKSNQHLQVLREIEKAILAAQSPDTIAQATLTRLQQLIPHERASVALFDFTNKEVMMLAVSGSGPLQRGSRFSLELYGNLTELAQGQYRLIHDLQSFPSLSQTGEMLHRSGLRSLLNVPLICQEELIGVLNFSATMPAAFTTAHANVAQDVADSLAVALQNAQLFQETEQQAHRLSLLYEATLTITGTLELEALLTRLGQQLYQMMMPDTILVALYDEAAEMVEVALVLEEGETLPESNNLRVPLAEAGLTGWVIRKQQSLLVADMEKEILPAQPYHGSQPAQSWLGVPLFIGEKVIGVLSVQSFHHHAFDEMDGRHLKMIGAQVAIAIHNAELFAKTEQLLEQTGEQAQRLQQLLDTIPEGVLLLDPDCRILNMNPTAAELLPALTAAKVGETLTDVGGQPVASLLVTSAADVSWQEVKALAGERVFELITQPIEVDAAINGWVVVLRDVTEERARQQQIQMQQRLATVGQLAAGIAHDFNNVMAIISLYSDLLSRKQGHKRRDYYLQTIIDQANHAAHLISQILDFSRRSVMRRSQLDLRPFVKEMVKLLQRTLPEMIDVQFAAEAGDYLVNADPTHLQQVLMNLAVNARDAMPDGGTLCISLTHLSLKAGEQPPVPDMAAGKWHCLRVADSGSGIAAETLPHLFEPFFTTKQPGEGTGLGLAQVYGIIKQHGGEIEVASERGAGATFTIHLPAITEMPDTAVVAEETEIASGAGQTILLVEDNDTAREAMAEILETLNYQVVTAAEGAEAVRLFTDRADEIALVLTDMVMPRMGGAQLFTQLKAIKRDVQVVVVTGHPLEESGQELLSQGVMAWVQKPFSMEKLAGVIYTALGPAEGS